MGRAGFEISPQGGSSGGWMSPAGPAARGEANSHIPTNGIRKANIRSLLGAKRHAKQGGANRVNMTKHAVLRIRNR